MENSSNLENLKKKYIELSRRYLEQIKNGKTVDELKDHLDEIRSLGTQIESLEKSG